MALNTPTHPIHSAPIGKRILIGALFALLFITFYVSGVNDPNPAWGKFWMLRPIIVVTVAGAIGGALYYFMDHLRYQGGWKKVVAIIISFVGYLVAVWLGTVAGLDGTLWD